jgi:hypothetical protein
VETFTKGNWHEAGECRLLAPHHVDTATGAFEAKRDEAG